MNTAVKASHTDAINIVKFIDDRKLGSYQIRLIFLCALVAMFDGFDAQSIAFVAPIIAKQFGMEIPSFAPIFAANLVGMAVGAVTLGSLADRVGRKTIIIASTFIFGIFSLLTVLADSSSHLIIYRLLTGLGLGAAMPNILALTSEYSPKRIRAWMITLMFVGFPFGAVVGGIISSKIIPVWGWESVFFIGGVGPITLALCLFSLLSESIHFMSQDESKAAKIHGIMKKIAPEADFKDDQKFFAPEQKLTGAAVKHLFTQGRGAGTIILWVPFFMNLLLLFFMYNWLPPVLQLAGLPIENAIMGTVLFNLGGVVGGMIMARFIDRIGPYIVLGTAYALGALSVASIGLVSGSIPLIMTAIFIAGFWVVGAQFGANVLAASYYPTAIRSTGVGWALGIGRIGSIVGPIVGGILLSFKWPFSDLFLAASVPAAIAAVAIVLLRYIAQKNSSQHALDNAM